MRDDDLDITMDIKGKKEGFNIREAFRNGQNSHNLALRMAANLARYLWDTGAILGSGVSKAESPIKRVVKK